jgi:hypothetical protein
MDGDFQMLRPAQRTEAVVGRRRERRDAADVLDEIDFRVSEGAVIIGDG